MRFWNPVRNLLLCGLLALFIGLIGWWLYGLPGWFPGTMVLAAGISNGVGFWQGKKNEILPRICFLLLLIGSGIGAYKLFDAFVGGAFTGTVLICAIETVCFLFTHRSQDSFYGPLGVSTVLASLLSILLCPKIWTVIAAVSAMVFTLDGFRVMGLYQSHHMGKSGQITRKDPALFRSSLQLFAMGLLLLILGAGLLYLLFSGVFSLLKLLWDAISGPLHQITVWVEMQLDALWLWILSHFHEIGPEGGSHTSEIKPHYHFDLPENSYAIAWLPLAGLLAVLVSIGLVTVKAVKKRPPRTNGDYVDTIEFLERPRFSIKSWLTDRKAQKITDFADNNMKIRFVFQQFLRDKCRSEPNACSKTPTELADESDPVESHLAQIYNGIRYGKANATDEDVALAAEYLDTRVPQKHPRHTTGNY